MNAGNNPTEESYPELPSESVWDYPRPPSVEVFQRRILVQHAGVTLAACDRGYRVLETSHPPVYYLPTDCVRSIHLQRSRHRSVCEWKGIASYWHVKVGNLRVENAAWSYANPNPGYAQIRDHLAFYAGKLDTCILDGVQVGPQPGGFYGGWIAPEIRGPFKGEPGFGGE